MVKKPEPNNLFLLNISISNDDKLKVEFRLL